MGNPAVTSRIRHLRYRLAAWLDVVSWRRTARWSCCTWHIRASTRTTASAGISHVAARRRTSCTPAEASTCRVVPRDEPTPGHDAVVFHVKRRAYPNNMVSRDQLRRSPRPHIGTPAEASTCSVVPRDEPTPDDVVFHVEHRAFTRTTGSPGVSPVEARGRTPPDPSGQSVQVVQTGVTRWPAVPRCTPVARRPGHRSRFLRTRAIRRSS